MVESNTKQNIMFPIHHISLDQCHTLNLFPAGKQVFLQEINLASERGCSLLVRLCKVCFITSKALFGFLYPLLLHCALVLYEFYSLFYSVLLVLMWNSHILFLDFITVGHAGLKYVMPLYLWADTRLGNCSYRFHRVLNDPQ